jgi:hypothetical protein
MKFEELSQEDQMLVQTQFPEELEKSASAEISLAQELYTAGFSKFASATAEALEKLAEEGKESDEEEEKEHEKKLDEDQKKEASARGAFIARGYIDGLKKLGSDNYGDEMAYLYPFIQEKMAGLEALKGMAGKAVKGTEALGSKIVSKGIGMGGKTGKVVEKAGDLIRQNPKSAMGAAAAIPVAAGVGMMAAKKKKD